MTSENGAMPVILGRYAGFFTRAAAYALDQVFIFGITFIILIVIDYFINLFRIDEWFASLNITGSIGPILTALLSSIGIGFVVTVIYNIGFWMLSGQTPGKRILGVRVLRTDGERLRLSNAVLRQVGYWISTFLFLGFLWILIDKRRQGFHDKIGGTIVTYSWPEGRMRGTFVIERVQRFQDRRS